MCNLASPAYLRQHGVPQSLDDLAHHRIVYYANNLRNQDAVWRYARGDTVRALPMRAALTVNSATFMVAAALKGLGIVQLSAPTCQRLLDSGELIEVLPAFAPPPLQVSLLLPHRRHIAARVEAVLSWIMQVTRPQML